jgi:chromosome segregation ATPase
MNINEQLTCKYCKEIFNEPVTLSCCGINICKRHIDELLSIDESNTFLCPFCDAENANQHYCINGLIQTLVQNELHKLEMNSDHKVTFNSLKAEIEKLEAVLKDPENIIYEEIHELKRKVDLDRERLKSEIDELANGLIQQLEEYEAKFKSDYKKNVDLEHFNALVESSRKKLTEYEKFFNLFSTKQEERVEKNKQTVQETHSLKSQIKKFKSKLFSNLSLTYKPTEHGVENLFGELLVKVSLYSK